MTNRKLLTAALESLTTAERHEQFLQRAELSAVPCPACLKPVCALDAAGVEIEAYEIGVAARSYGCPHCSARPEKSHPDFRANPGWLWHLDTAWLTERLEKADACDREHGTK